MILRILVLLLGALLTPGLAGAVESAAEPAAPSDAASTIQQIRWDQKLDTQLPLDLEFVDESGKPVKLGDYFGKRPVILAMGYYNCPMLCGLVLRGIVESLRSIKFDVGQEYEVVIVSISPKETPAEAAQKKKMTLKIYGRPGTEPSWHFLSGQQKPITQLADAIGFHYIYEPKTGDYGHPAGITVVTPQGKIARYFYGIEYAPRDLRLGLIEAAEGKIGSAVDQVFLLCYGYDPSTGKYSLLVMRILRIFALLTVIFLAGGIYWLKKNEPKQQATGD